MKENIIDNRKPEGKRLRSTDSGKYIDLHSAATNPTKEPPPPRDVLEPSLLKKRLWVVVQSLLFRPAPQSYFGWWRRTLWRLFGATVGKGVQIRPTVRVTCPWNIEIRDYVWIGDFVELYSLGKIVIGEDAVISQHVYLCTGTHDYNQLDFPLVTKPITIEKEAWIATRCFVAPGVTIGRGAIIGAQSVVMHDVPSATIFSGNPAVFIKPRPLPMAHHGSKG